MSLVSGLVRGARQFAEGPVTKGWKGDVMKRYEVTCQECGKKFTVEAHDWPDRCCYCGTGEIMVRPLCAESPKE